MKWPMKPVQTSTSTPQQTMNRKPMKKHLHLFAVLTLLVSPVIQLQAQTTAFTYQGRLGDGAGAVSGRYDLRFALYDDASTGNKWGPTLTNGAVVVSNGVFTTALDFGSGIFTGGPRWMEIGVRTNGSGAFTALAPRQWVTPSPYAVFANSASSAGTLSGVVPAGGLSGPYSGAVSFSNPASSFAGNGGGLTNVNGAALGGLPSSGYWKTGGNGATTAGQFLGTTDNKSLAVKVNNTTALRIDPTVSMPNIVAGADAIVPTFIAANVRGAIVAGGNAPAGPVNGYGAGDYHAVYDSDGTIGGGFGNKVGTDNGNADDAPFATVAGGVFNFANNYAATVAGGDGNLASGTQSAVGGGAGNRATGAQATVPGGLANEAGADLTLAAGYRAKALNRGSFVWADSTDADFASTGNNQFDVRAYGGTRFETAGAGMTIDGSRVVTSSGAGSGLVISTSGGFGDPQLTLKQSNPADWARLRIQTGGPAWDVALSPGAQPMLNFWNGSADVLSLAQNGDATLSGSLRFGTGALRQVLDLWAGQHGIGVQAWTTYFRTIGGGANGGFAWYKGGVHADAQYDAGGGEELMRLSSGGLHVQGSALISKGATTRATARQLAISHTGDSNWGLNLGYVFNPGVEASGVIQALDNGNPAWLHINPAGGQVLLGSGSDVSWGDHYYSKLTADQGGSIEIGNSLLLSATPHIDFHYGINGVQDFNVRLINDGNNQLTCTGNFLAQTLTPLSDRNAKENITEVDSREVLEKVAALPIARWNFKTEAGIGHLGPMAQDFREAFNLGADDKHIATVDADGVALAAIQGLNQKLIDKEVKLAAQSEQIGSLQERLKSLEQLVSKLTQTR